MTRTERQILKNQVAITGAMRWLLANARPETVDEREDWQVICEDLHRTWDETEYALSFGG